MFVLFTRSCVRDLLHKLFWADEFELCTKIGFRMKVLIIELATSGTKEIIQSLCHNEILHIMSKNKYIDKYYKRSHFQTSI